ncbi:alpha-amylase [Lactobacillus amylovorus DSM 20531]|uniref:glycoside hydrolase family 13 protein n=1 Tax=Lactobacillus amylovorus TaxID=1604 RepID=UPI0006F01B04|nr:glycoside hydrolase family 13 protein [Lactobacillus amylovorus]ATO53696.1 alpha-amylase [Lactobacillus amylovorus DSM 20531]KRK44877.1 amylopullulanase [Lactobacillus amylovorus DSM 20531]MCT3591751.1 glycoside hydrolase family 13 protein [Lactobacillus amylovorus]
MKVTYDSWQKQYKTPFGAIQANTLVTWAIAIDQPVQEADLWLTKLNEDPVAYPMNYNDETQKYETQVRVGSSGLYNYYFAIKQNNQMFYVDQGLFGQGRLRQDDHNLKQYQLICYERKVPQVDWYDQGIVYQIFPDRFANGNPYGEVTGRKKNSFLYATEEDTPYYVKNSRGEITRWDFFGGNLAGIRKKLPYLKKLGVNTIYLNPIFLATSNHRYDTVDYMKIDPMLGDEDDLRGLIHDLHQNGMHLLLDGVFNHVGQESIYFQEAIKDKSSHYYSWFNFIDYPEEYQSWWGVSSLPEVNKSNPEYQDFIYGDHGVLAKWMKDQVDGWRLDVADELPMDFLRNIRNRLMKENCQVMIGEVWGDASDKFVNSEYRPYTFGDNLTGVMNYPVRNFIVGLLTSENNDAEIALMNKLALLVEHYPTNFLRNCLNNIGTHDTVRIKTALQNDEKLVLLAFGLMFMLPGVPCIYYGDEAGLIGDKDPDNRRFFPWGRESRSLIAQVSKWINVRKQNPVLVKIKIGFLHIATGINAIVRYDEKVIMVYCINKNKAETVLAKENFAFYCLPKTIAEEVAAELDQTKLSGEDSILRKISRKSNIG